ncbi:unnamed protein product [Agarophyton chilense]|eukprot:gb/GEZJ01002267.1/.p3 GENE.gb/GEZJ01002267.1/~~gb/GEZJ01002267.1/.p3  ORF type:complete len:150 (+),score=21.19 gb/GEZJ01002267.1/:931-1380(+)
MLSVLNSLGHSVSYASTEAYRLKLISDREKTPRGAWKNVPLSETSFLLTCQFDNWDLMPLHAVKANGKSMPKVNGALLQSVCRAKKNDETLSIVAGDNEWKPVPVLGDRNNFSANLASAERREVLHQIADVMFGLVITHREKLLDCAQG